ncbi:membrane biogenesis protein [Azospirillum sp. TSH100]|uniref:AsmA family protein n=1 Tax=Azospirillum sp. TSH100 TaxID=652764 RepID=UPI000D61BAD9|nr:AsmA family protein [Azospirillum sp. TSH100]PWC87243.1 membrane biogenesis protein [Azospirillum sp. TSH100]QCG89974.1 AsmA family protein [Azospirillum sp. TSH100]
MKAGAGSVVKWIGYGLLGLAGLVVVGIGALVLMFDWNDARGFVARRASAALNREVAIDGDLRVHLGSPIRIHLEGLRVANAEWAQDRTMAEVQALDATLRLWPLLRGDWELPELKVQGPKLILEKNGKGEANWNFGPPNAEKEVAKQAAVPDNRGDIPVIERLLIADGRLHYRDPTSDIDIDNSINTATGGNDSDTVQLKGKGSFAGKPFTLAVEGGSLLHLRDDPKPYPLKIDAAVGKTKGHIEGSVGEPVKMEGVDLSVALSGDDMAEIFPIVGIPTPKTRPYAISGHLGREGKVWTFRGMNGKVGESDLSGDVLVDTGGDRPMVKADLTSNRLAALDLAGLIGASPRGSDDYPTRGNGRVIPATPIPVEKLRNTDMDVRLRGKRVEAPFAPLEGLEMQVKLANGDLHVDPLTLGIGGGRIAGTVQLDGKGKVPAMRTNLDIRAMKLSAFFSDTSFAGQIGGTVAGRIQLAGTGRTVADLLATSDGKIGVAVDGGRVTSLAVKGLKTNILETLGVVISGSKPMPFNCLVGNMAVQNGIAQVEALVLDTPETLVTGKGRISLRNEALDLRIVGDSKSPQVFATHVPVLVGGTLGNPDIGVDPTESAARGAAAVALGVLLTPLAGVLPFLDPGSDEQPQCGRLVRDARSPEKGGPASGKSGNGRGDGTASGSAR